MSEQPSRYNRSFGGMTGALLVTVVFVLAFVLWRSLFQDGDEEDPTPTVDWRESVTLAEQADLPVVHPRELPAGWRATSVELRAGDRPVWGMGVLTDDGRFVGIRQEDASVADLVETYIDEDAAAGPDASVASDVTGTWQTWSDDGGDHGYSTELGDETLLVYGSASTGDLETYLGLLTR